MRISLYIVLFYSIHAKAQPFLNLFEGNYKGTLEVYSKNITPVAFVPVNLTIKSIIKDSIWQYRMVYGNPETAGYTEKDYTIVWSKDQYILDEGDEITIPMTQFGNCLMDFYTIQNKTDPTYMHSSLCREINGDLTFHLSGGTMAPLTSIEMADESGESLTLSTFPLSFYQTVSFKKIP